MQRNVENLPPGILNGPILSGPLSDYCSSPLQNIEPTTLSSNPMTFSLPLHSHQCSTHRLPCAQWELPYMCLFQDISSFETKSYALANFYRGIVWVFNDQSCCMWDLLWLIHVWNRKFICYYVCIVHFD